LTHVSLLGSKTKPFTRKRKFSSPFRQECFHHLWLKPFHSHLENTKPQETLGVLCFRRQKMT
jgi:hypothetical protein